MCEQHTRTTRNARSLASASRAERRPEVPIVLRRARSHNLDQDYFYHSNALRTAPAVRYVREQRLRAARITIAFMHREKRDARDGACARSRALARAPSDRQVQIITIHGLPGEYIPSRARSVSVRPRPR